MTFYILLQTAWHVWITHTDLSDDHQYASREGRMKTGQKCGWGGIGMGLCGVDWWGGIGGGGSVLLFNQQETCRTNPILSEMVTTTQINFRYDNHRHNGLTDPLR